MRVLLLASWLAAVFAFAESELPRKQASPQVTTNGVAFSYSDAEAFAVSVAGDFNQWSINSHMLERGKNGLWTITVPLKPGKYQYQFNVNGIYWKHDPNNPNKIADNYGGLKSIVEVPNNAATAPASQAETAVPVQTKFTYVDPSAKEVAVGGFFNKWSHTANVLTKDDRGIWTGIVPLKPGSHPYKFWVDGKWILDPVNAVAVADGFGGSNSVVNVSQ